LSEQFVAADDGDARDDDDGGGGGGDDDDVVVADVVADYLKRFELFLVYQAHLMVLY
jgi:hypothetical protein